MKKLSINSFLRLLILSFLLMLSNIGFAKQPNVIVILVDDAGYNDWGFQGSSVMETPKIDQLKESGIYFSHAYVTHSVCAPSRAGLITGRYQNRFGFEINLVDPIPAPGYTIEEAGLEENEKTIGDYMKDLEYSTAAIGKWHLGEEDKHHPNNRGFDYFYGLLSGSRPYFHTNDLPSGKKLMRNFAVDDLTEGYMTDVLTDDAITWIKQQANNNQPFFTYLSYTAVHGPYESKQKDFDHFSEGCIGFDGNECSDVRQHYAAMTYNLDYNVGKLVDSLKSLDIYENTLIFFMNDNGGKSEGEITDNAPLRGGKASQFEGGLRVPFFIVWPGKIPAGDVYDKQVISLDILPTVINAAGGQLPLDNDLDGVDLLPIINDQTKIAHDYLFWRKMFYYGVVQSNNKKLIINYNGPEDSDNDTLLYDLSVDISETNNLYTSKDDPLISDLLSNYHNWAAELAMPAWLTDYNMNKMCDGESNPENCDNILIAYGLMEEKYPLWTGEAEDGILSGNYEIKTGCSNASGDFVNLFSDSGNTLQFANIEVTSGGIYQLRIYHFNNSDLPIRIFVNDELLSETVLSKGNWCYEGPPKITNLNVKLDEGVNTIKFCPENGVNSPLLDKIGLYESETATNTKGRNLASNSCFLHPNPCGEDLFISGVKREVEFSIYNINGVIVNNGITSGTLDVSNLPGGTYFIKVSDCCIKKFIKK